MTTEQARALEEARLHLQACDREVSNLSARLTGVSRPSDGESPRVGSWSAPADPTERAELARQLVQAATRMTEANARYEDLLEQVEQGE